ncbi:hypothetical protein B0H14DRAFT_3436876 [Mycena olivaceomarginata]|nr:hypothetical protein B0H14DRAFT_3436876 [Mycena olivaceomarginata]
MAPDVTANILSYRRLPHMDLASAAYSPAGDANVALPRPTHNQDVVTPSDHDLNHMVPYVAYDARGTQVFPAMSISDLSLRHLPDLSDVSFSFQIPTDSGHDLLRGDLDDFLRGAVIVPGSPSSHRANDAQYCTVSINSPCL